MLPSPMIITPGHDLGSHWFQGVNNHWISNLILNNQSGHVSNVKQTCIGGFESNILLTRFREILYAGSSSHQVKISIIRSEYKTLTVKHTAWSRWCTGCSLSSCWVTIYRLLQSDGFSSLDALICEWPFCVEWEQSSDDSRSLASMCFRPKPTFKMRSFEK